jgi:hypothetical protein
MAHKQSSLAAEDVHIGIIIKRNDGVQCFGVSTVLDDVTLFAFLVTSSRPNKGSEHWLQMT